MQLNEVYTRVKEMKRDAMVGRIETVLVESKDNGGSWKGRCDGNIQVVLEGEIPGDQEIKKGDIVGVKTIRRKGGTLIGLRLGYPFANQTCEPVPSLSQMRVDVRDR